MFFESDSHLHGFFPSFWTSLAGLAIIKSKNLPVNWMLKKFKIHQTVIFSGLCISSRIHAIEDQSRKTAFVQKNTAFWTRLPPETCCYLWFWMLAILKRTETQTSIKSDEVNHPRQKKMRTPAIEGSDFRTKIRLISVYQKTVFRCKKKLIPTHSEVSGLDTSISLMFFRQKLAIFKVSAPGFNKSSLILIFFFEINNNC
jgi:hypothetical protein